MPGRSHPDLQSQNVQYSSQKAKVRANPTQWLALNLFRQLAPSSGFKVTTLQIRIAAGSVEASQNTCPPPAAVPAQTHTANPAA